MRPEPFDHAPPAATGPARLSRDTPVPPTRDTPCHDARALLGDRPSVQIVLDDQIYTLRVTKAQKLILTK